MSYDKLASRYLDKVFPETRQVTGRDLERMGIPPEMHDMANQIVEEHKAAHNGMMPTVDQVVVEHKRRMFAARRRGI